MSVEPNSPIGDGGPENTLVTTDKSLLNRYRRGDDDAATELYLRYAGRLRALATSQSANDLKQRVDAEDLVQSVFRTFFRRAANGQYDIPEGDELWKLLLVIGLNKIRSVAIFHRADRRDMSRTQSGLVADQAISRAGAEDEVALSVLRLTIDELLSPLPALYREIVDLRIAGHEIHEISAQVGRSKRSVERILQEFRQKLGELVHVSA